MCGPFLRRRAQLESENLKRSPTGVREATTKTDSHTDHISSVLGRDRSEHPSFLKGNANAQLLPAIEVAQAATASNRASDLSSFS